ncbi:MAG: DUF1573 domain-containing protein [Bacteroidales bacterium]|jgi:hypothetical protein|nr:DUF1573 domain-containing protein [Bacteroidales bacterium]
MKKVIYLLGIMLLMAGAAKAQDKETVQMGPEIEFEKLVHDYGDVPYNGNGECEFRFTNTGTEPLLVQKPKSSCGCTIPSWPNEPILPGESDVIKVTYRTNRAGNINKTVTVTSNAVKNSTVVLRIKGRVLDQPTEVLPANNNGMGAPVNNN